MLRLNHLPGTRSLRRHFPILSFVLVLFMFMLGLDKRGVHLIARDSRLMLTMQFEQAERGQEVDVYQPADPSPLKVHLVVAATAAEDISWALKLKIPGFEVIHYVADDQSWPNHPQLNKGHEPTIYNTYFYDYYDKLPDIVILTHAQDVSWHMEPLFNHSLTYALRHLDLQAVMERGYANLRVSWENACPAYINTTLRGDSGIAAEGESTHDAFLANFGHEPELEDDVPEILAQPCCNQFAVTRDAIRSVSKDQFARSLNWIFSTPMNDYTLGRTWEHMYQWLFAKKAVDCPIEWKAYCKMYHICFASADEYQQYMNLEEERAELIDMYDVSPFKAFYFWGLGSGKQRLAEQIGAVTRQIDALAKQARERGTDEKARAISMESLYLEV
jgi:hypothetical protein